MSNYIKQWKRYYKEKLSNTSTYFLQDFALCVQRGHTDVIKETTQISLVSMSLEGWFRCQYGYTSLKFVI